MKHGIDYCTCIKESRPLVTTKSVAGRLRAIKAKNVGDAISHLTDDIAQLAKLYEDAK